MLRFDYTPSEIIATTNEAIAEWKEGVALDFVDENASFIDVMEARLSTLSRRVVPLMFLAEVSPDTEVREASRSAKQIYAKFGTEMNQRVDLYQRCLRDCGKSSSFDVLLNRYIRGYRHHGCHLTQPEREHLKTLLDQHDDLELKYEENCSEDVGKIIVQTADLDGLDADYIERTRQDDGTHVITSAYPDVIPVLQYCHSEQTRSAVNNMYSERAPQNIPILLELNELRRKIANLLGYKNRQHLVLEDKMLNTEADVRDMLETVSAKLKSATLSHVHLLERIKGGALEDQDYLYYHDWHLKNNYNVDTQKLREYFPLEHVLNEMLTIFATMLGLTFEKVASANSASTNSVSTNSASASSASTNSASANSASAKWHDDVTSYVVRDQHGDTMGLFYLDLFPRDGKYTHAMETVIQQGRPGLLHVSALVCNFSHPSQDKPSLLSFDEVVTLFHEFGHVVHDICSGYSQKYPSLACLEDVETDFVEAPSQFIEQWLWSPYVLKRITRHYETGERIPDDILQKFLSTRFVGVARDVQRQVALSVADQNTPSCSTVEEIKHECATVLRDYLGYDCGNGDRMATWGHLAGNYDSRYYSYVWSLIVASDLFSRFEQSGDILNPVLGRLYRQTILSKGSSVPAKDMVRAFMGRDVSLDAIMAHCGV